MIIIKTIVFRVFFVLSQAERWRIEQKDRGPEWNGDNDVPDFL